MTLDKILNPGYIFRNRENIIPAIRRLLTSPVRTARRYSALRGIPLNKNDKRLFELKDKHKGERCFIIGNGPSLQIKDLQLLSDKKDICFAFNKIFLAFEDTAFRPTYYIIEDPLVIKNTKNELKKLGSFPKFFPYIFRYNLRDVSNALYYYLDWDDFYPGFPEFSCNPFDLHWGATVVYTALQLAIYMGCNPIYLIGIDFYFKESIVTDPGKKHVMIADGEKNHFHPDYRPPGEKWYIPRLDHQKKSFLAAKKYALANDIKIINASRETHLDVFDQINLDQVIN